ncbi:monooxygenase [Marasmius fiardii PR-910]|nr:monooxygenase [Marasmius fiardii PR-910]
MYFIAVALLLFTLFHNGVQAQCTSPSVRREWRELSDAQKQDYHRAVRCLMSRPSRRYPNRRDVVISRWDDLTWTHAQLRSKIHWVAPFLPWHRMFIQEHENMLRNECNYRGPYAYWDWSIDADRNAVPSSPVWDGVVGFGANGVRTGNSTSGFERCVVNGPYANHVNTVGAPGRWDINDMRHCLTRQFSNKQRDRSGNLTVGDMGGSNYNSAVVRDVYSRERFLDFHMRLEGGPHGVVHDNIGGDMQAPYSAPNDPLFYLHHANIDRIWTQWQGNNASRLNDYGGTNDQRSVTRASINDKLPILNLLDHPVTVRDYMNTKRGPLCYQYTRST